VLAGWCVLLTFGRALPSARCVGAAELLLRRRGQRRLAGAVPLFPVVVLLSWWCCRGRK
jgi:hypothetical protein